MLVPRTALVVHCDMKRGTRPNLRILLFFGLMVISLGGLLLLPPIAQDQNYHEFADQRTIFGIPNFWNVVSNLPFLAVGAAGLRRFRGNSATVVFFLGVFLTGIGSSYYHWNPNDDTLFWDRLPMTLAFAAILALVVHERVSERAGAILLWPALAVILLFALYPPKYTGACCWIAAGALYALAKLFEFADEPIYSIGKLLSGHTLKHLAAAAACFAILRYFQVRRPIAEVGGAERAAEPMRSLKVRL